MPGLACHANNFMRGVYVDNLGLFEESDDDIRADYFHLMFSQITIQKYQNVKGRLFWESTY